MGKVERSGYSNTKFQVYMLIIPLKTHEAYRNDWTCWWGLVKENRRLICRCLDVYKFEAQARMLALEKILCYYWDYGLYLFDSHWWEREFAVQILYMKCKGALKKKLHNVFDRFDTYITYYSSYPDRPFFRQEKNHRHPRDPFFFDDEPRWVLERRLWTWDLRFSQIRKGDRCRSERHQKIHLKMGGDLDDAATTKLTAKKGRRWGSKWLDA